MLNLLQRKPRVKGMSANGGSKGKDRAAQQPE
jgi:hypothetical protein